MAHYERLKEMTEPTPWLLANGEAQSVELVSEADALAEMKGEGRFAAATLLNVRHAVDVFAQMKGPLDRTFSSTEVAAVAGVPYSALFVWMREGTLTPSVPQTGQGRGRSAQWTWAEAFTAGLVGALRRHGLSQKVVRQVQPLLCGSKKQTGRRRLPASRS